MTASPPKPDWLEQALERCEAATPGPWVAGTWTVCVGEGADAPYWEGPGSKASPRQGEDAALMAHARTDLPRALTALQAADALVEAMNRVERAERSKPLAELRGELFGLWLEELRYAREALRRVKAEYLAARHGEPQEQG